MIPCDRSPSKHLKLNNSTYPGIVCESLHEEEFHKSQNGAGLGGIYRSYCLFKILYLEQCCWHLENVGLHSYFNLTVTYRLHCAKDHTVEAARPLTKGQSTQYLSRQSTKIWTESLTTNTNVSNYFGIIIVNQYECKSHANGKVSIIWLHSSDELVFKNDTVTTSSCQMCTNECQSFLR